MDEQLHGHTMRGSDTFTESLFMMRHLDDFVPASDPLLRPIWARETSGVVKKD